MVMEKFLRPEILAPVGDKRSFEAALNCGADAVYLGVNDFNARTKCDNFTLEEIGGVISKAHLYGVKVYITLNTLVRDDEVGAFLRAVDVLYNAKADAFIMQDIGMAQLVKKLYPAAVLHASTQMGIHDLEGALFLEKCGYKRVILARETKLADIEDIKNNTDLEIEFFVQGALCVAFSGNCYLSSVKDGSSGNRGACHQLCRLPYSCGDKKGYLLSPADLNLIDKTEELIKAGVVSFKIEGRMKRPAYVAATVKAFKAKLDGSDQKSVERAVEDISHVFSRGEYDKDAYLYSNDDIIDDKHNNNTGIKLGTVESVRPFKDLFEVTVRACKPLGNGDGLKIISDEEITLGVGAVKTAGSSLYTFITAKSGIGKGNEVYRTNDVSFEASLTDEKRFFPVDVHVTAYAGKPLSMTLSCGGTSVTAISDALEKALSDPLDENGVISQMKFGDLPFELRSVKLDTDGVFVLKSKLNAVRRDAVELLSAAITEKNTPARPTVHPSEEEIKKAVRSFTKLSDGFKGSGDCILCKEISAKALKSGKTIVFSPDDYNDLSFKKVPITGLYADFYLDLPIIATNKDMPVIDKLLAELDGYLGKKCGVVVNNYFGFKYLGARPVEVGYGMNVYNKISGGFYLSLGVNDIVFSGELKRLADFVGYDADLPLMTFCHCPYKVSVDSKCSDCKALRPITYKDARGNAYEIKRYKLFYCYFRLTMAGGQYLKLVPKLSTRKLTRFDG